MSAAVRTLPQGVRHIPLESRPDARGRLVEMFRESNAPEAAAVQWNVVDSKPGVLRGVHVHRTHWDYLVVLTGRASIGLQDIRPGSPTHGVAVVVPMNGTDRSAIVIPPGVAHGFFFHEPSLHIYGVTHYWDPADELGCKWDDPGLHIPWDIRPTELSPRDRDAPPLSKMLADYLAV